MKVKVFTYNSPQDLEKAVNNWLEAAGTTPSHIIQSQSMEENQLFITLTVFYKEKGAPRPKGVSRAN
jgi:hypothetical protein